ncbi:MAG: hypothetical protein CALGDGBN_01399 [Pseudomonadales bacterium]|nr:hypothetical protein [Pseudomonadales bacterium]
MAAACVRSERRHWRLAGRIACGFVFALAASADALAPAWDWKRIELEARKFMLVASSSVSVTVPSAQEVAGQLVEVPGHRGIPVPAAGVWRIDARSRLPGISSHVTVWLARDTLQVLQRERLDSARGGRYKLTRFIEGGSYEWQRRGVDAPRGSAPARWPLKRERLHPAERAADCTDSLGLLLLAADLVRTERVRTLARVCTDDGALGVALTRQGEAAYTIAHTRVRAGARREADGETACRHVGIAIESNEQAVDDFRLLGLAGRLQVCVDTESGAPLRLVGTEPRLGEFRIQATLIESDG